MPEPFKPAVVVSPKPGHGGWVPKKKTPLLVALSLGVTASLVPTLMTDHVTWNLVLASVLTGASTALATFFGMVSAGPRKAP